MNQQVLAEHGWWLASRASGLVALALVTISVALGLTMAGRLSSKPGANRVLSAIHEQTAVVGLIAIAVHGLTLLGDPFLNPGLAGISIPFVMDYRPLWTGLGIIAGGLAAALGLSFYFRKRFGPRMWRKAHRATIVVYILGVMHTLGAGTDATSPWLLYPLALASAWIAVLFVARVAAAVRKSRKAAGRRDRPARAPRRRPSPEGPAIGEGRA